MQGLAPTMLAEGYIDERHQFWHDVVLYWKARESLYEAHRGCQGTSYARSCERYQWTISSVQHI
jgi:hypothetical protein